MKNKDNKLIAIIIFLVSLEVFFWLNGFTSTAFWHQLGRFGLSYKATFLLTFGTLSWIFFLIAIISAAYIMHKKILSMKAFSILTIIAFYLGGFGFWLFGFIPAFGTGGNTATIWCSPFSNKCLGLPSNIFAPFVYFNIALGLILIFILLRKEKIY